MIAIRADQAKLARLLKSLDNVPRGMTTAQMHAINRSLTTVRTEMVRMVRSEYALKAGAVRKNLAIRKAWRGKLEGRVHGEDSPGLPLKEFARIKRVPSTRRTGRGGYTPKVGIPVLIRKDRGKRVAEGVFLARMSSGFEGAFKRTGAPGGRRRRGSNLGRRYIQAQYGPSPVYLLGAEKNLERIGEFTNETYNKRLHHEAQNILRKEGLLKQ